MRPIRSIPSITAAAFALAAISLASSEARADWSPVEDYSGDSLPYIRGMGLDHYFAMRVVYMPNSVVDFEEDPQNPPVSGTGYVQWAASLLPLPTMFGALGGLEADISLGFPLGKSYFGGLGFNGGIVVQPISFRYLRASVAFGVGFNAHAYGYLKPRIAFVIVPDWVDGEVSYRYIPEYTSNVFGGKEDGLEDAGFREQRLRTSLFIHVGSKKVDDRKLEPNMAVELSFEYMKVKGDAKDLERFRLRSGDYMSFGLGVAM